MTGDAPKIFVSYSHSDIKALEQLQTHIKPLARDGSLDLWDDTRIRAADVWRSEIDGAMASAAAAILLVSAKSLASDFIHQHELPPIFAAWEERRIKVYWVLLSPCNHQLYPTLERLQAVNPGLTPLNRMRRWEKDQLWADLAWTIAEDQRARTAPGTPAAAAPGSREFPRAGPDHDRGPIASCSRCYVERDTDCRIVKRLTENERTVTIKGFLKSGKSSILDHINAWALANGIATCIVSFRSLDAATLKEAPALFRGLARLISSRLGLEVPSHWSPRVDSVRHDFTTYLVEDVLQKIDRPLLLLLDDADLTFPYSDAREELFGTLRVWHEESARERHGRGWDRLRGLVVAHSTDPALWIQDLDQSLFNVGANEILDDFTEPQVAELQLCYQRSLDANRTLASLTDWLGGHPYLLRQAFSWMATRGCDREQLLRASLREDGPFASHLWHLGHYVLGDRKLKYAVRAIIEERDSIDEFLFQRLWSAGLVTRNASGQIKPRYLLYDAYFRTKFQLPSRDH
jgi:hypothetical protein